jgi:hypothetical protein
MKEFKLSDKEQMMLRLFDENIAPDEREKIDQIVRQDRNLKLEYDAYRQMRDVLAEKRDDSYGPFFAERIINQVKRRTQEIDYLIFFFFKKYQVLIAGVLVGLLVINIILADKLTILSILGFQDETVEDFVTIDVYENLTE